MFPKPAKGEHRARTLAKRSHEAYVEQQAKDAAKRRDGHACRRPGCTTNLRQWRLEAAHLEDQGMGGRHAVSNERRHYLSACYHCHQGTRSLHSGDLRVTPISAELGADGLLLWEELTEAGWIALGMS